MKLNACDADLKLVWQLQDFGRDIGRVLSCDWTGNRQADMATLPAGLAVEWSSVPGV